jgi:hypothetical protein
MTDHTDLILAAMTNGERLGEGDFNFRPPLMIEHGYHLRGRGIRTRLHPIQDGVQNTAVWMRSRAETDASNLTNFPRGATLEDVHVVGSQIIYGVWFEGARIRLRRVTITGCHFGLTSNWSVDQVISDTLLAYNKINVNLRHPNAGEDPNAMTTVAFRDCQIRSASEIGVKLDRGFLILFDNCKIESNTLGMFIDPSVDSVEFRNTWWENNKPHGNIQGAVERCLFSGITKNY